MASTASAPGRFSTTTGWPHCLESRSASMRPVMSAPEPGPSDRTNLTGRCGQDCAAAIPEERARARTRIIFMESSLLFIVDGDLDQVQVGIAHVDRANLALRASLRHRPFDDRD